MTKNIAGAAFLGALFFLAFPPHARAGDKDKACSWIPSKTKGQKAKLTIAGGPGEALAIPVPLDAAGFGSYECMRWNGPDNAEAIHFRAFEQEGGRAFEAFVDVYEGKAKLVWSGMTGLTGEFGERQGFFLDYEPAGAGSKTTVPILYFLDERVTLCGFGPAPIHVSMYDAQTTLFRPVSFDRLRRWKRKDSKAWGSPQLAGTLPKYEMPLVLTGSFEEEEESEEKMSMGNFLIFESSSSAYDAVGQVVTGSAPFSLTDGSAESGWVEGSGGDGSGEFVTAKTLSWQVPIEALEFRLAMGRSVKMAKSFNALSKFYVTTDQGKVFAVKVPADPRKFPDKNVVIKFPKQVKSKCISIIIDEVWFSSGSTGNHTFIAEVKARTSIEDSKGFADLINALHKEAKYSSLDSILSSVKGGGVAVVSGAWDSLDEKAKRFMLDHTGPNILQAQAGQALAEKQLAWVLDSKRYNELMNLERSFSVAPRLMLAWYESPPQPAMRDMASVILLGQGFDEAAGHVIGHYLQADPPENVVMDHVGLFSAIRQGFKQPLRNKADLEAIFTMTGGALMPPAGGSGKSWCGFLKEHFYAPAGEGGGEKSGSLDTGKKIALLHALHAGGGPGCAAALGRDIWDSADDFETRYYILELFKKLLPGCPACGSELEPGGLVHGALDMEDTVLKVAALEVVALSKGCEKNVKYRVSMLLEDESPWVRSKAAAVFAGLAFDDKAMGDKVLDMALSDFWPEVRREAVTAAFKLKKIPYDQAYQMLLDPSPDVRKIAIRLVVEKGIKSEEIGKALIHTAGNQEIRWDAREEAAFAVGKLCITGFEKELNIIAQNGLYPDSSEADIAAAAGAISSLGMLGWTKSGKTLTLAALPGIRSELRFSAIKALGQIGGKEAKEILGALAEDEDQSIREAAGAALENIAAGNKAECH
ncbi:MAG: hypothetical protein ABIJ56_10180 [Pseudomonadota bacterium]